MSTSRYGLMLLWMVAFTWVGEGLTEAGQCHDIRADLDRHGEEPTTAYAFSGTISSGLLRGSYSVVVNDVAVTPAGDLSVGGSYSYLAGLTITTDHGTLTGATLGVGVLHAQIRTTELAPAAPFAETHSVTGGTGRFAGATGRLFMTGDHLVVTPTGWDAEGQVNGQVCLP